MAKAKHPDFGNQPTATIDSTATQQIPSADGITLRSNVQDTSTVTSTTDSTRGSLSNISTTSIKQTDNRDDNSSAFDSSSDTECDDETITRVIERIPNELAPGETRMIQNGRLMLGPETINPGLRPPPSIGSIALQNSSDITFGNKTYIKGQVVIKNIYQDRLNGSSNAGYQEHENDAVETSKKEPPATLSSQAKSWQSSLKALIKDKPLLSSILIITLICFLSAGVAIICILTASGKTIFSPPIGDGDDDRVNVPPEKDIEGDIFPDPKPLRLVTRTEWLAQPPREVLADLKLPVNNVIIAHTATEGCTTQANCMYHVKLIQEFHISPESRNFSDIAYQFLVGGDGNAYEGRGWTKQGAHTKGYNVDSICIAFVGTFIKMKPPIAQLSAAKQLIQMGLDNNYIASNYSLYGHRQLAPFESPGQALYDIIKTWPHWSNTLSNNHWKDPEAADKAATTRTRRMTNNV
ncbi:peptidoglycan-recognition protein LC-like isoform X1 [Anopheles cruzii]|uniref:peptidoglycan-recognition protein LC-like isoform X1 n=1 Tax=Anopheles cruzii TaxID=68878 RepID=UPI0022EC4B71|nr:peptidoglycan-recognition protein LC-like isoform X1 [Anopheles cruzii]